MGPIGARDDVMVWVALLKSLADLQLPVATDIQEEIRNRFPNDLQFEAGEVFRAVEQRLLKTTITAGASPGSAE